MATEELHTRTAAVTGEQRMPDAVSDLACEAQAQLHRVRALIDALIDAFSELSACDGTKPEDRATRIAAGGRVLIFAELADEAAERAKVAASAIESALLRAA